MSVTIAISGKGGTGKTTLAAMIIRLLYEHTGKAVLAVDADPNSCLGLTLGIEPSDTVAQIREEASQKKPTEPGSDRLRTFEYGIQQVLTEAKGFDLLTMGRPEGPGCYCAANNLLRNYMDKFNTQYSFTVIDNEAGMEHLSRRTTNNVDLLCIVTEPAAVSKITAQRISDLAKSLPIVVKETGIIWNKAGGPQQLNGIKTFGWVPYDQDVFDTSSQSKTIFDLDKGSPAFSAVQKILAEKLGLK